VICVNCFSWSPRFHHSTLIFVDDRLCVNKCEMWMWSIPDIRYPSQKHAATFPSQLSVATSALLCNLCEVFVGRTQHHTESSCLEKKKKKKRRFLPCHPPLRWRGDQSKIFPPTFPFRHFSSRLAGTLLGRPCPFFARSLTLDHSLRVAVRAQNPQYVDNAVVVAPRVESSGTGLPCQRAYIVVPCLQSSFPPSAPFSLGSSESESVAVVGQGWQPSSRVIKFLVSSNQAGRVKKSAILAVALSAGWQSGIFFQTTTG
jgi:hypothetical protein